MRATFSFFRLIQLVRKQWFENARLYLFSVLALLGILGIALIILIKNSNNNYTEDSLYIIFTVGLFIFGSKFASLSFNMLGEKEKGTYWLGLPASHLEKLLCTIFYNFIVFTLVYCTCSFILDKLVVTYIQNLVAINPLKYHYRNIYWTYKNGYKDVLPFAIYTFFAVQAFYLLGSVYFARFSFVLTTVVGATLIGAFIWFCFYFLTKQMLPKYYIWNGTYIYHILFDNKIEISTRYQLSGTLVDILSFIVRFIWAPVFWIAAWYRLKEKEI